MGAQHLEIVIPNRIWELLQKCEEITGIKKEDLVMRAVVKVIEEFLAGRV